MTRFVLSCLLGVSLAGLIGAFYHIDVNADGPINQGAQRLSGRRWQGTGVAAAKLAAPNGRENSADQILFWIGWEECTSLTDAQLDQWRSRGVGGFVCEAQWLRGLGGKYSWTGDPSNALTAPEYAPQRQFRDSNVVSRARSRGMKMYLGFYLVNYWNGQTPLVEWFDDSGWAYPIAMIRDRAAAARLLGFTGLSFDQELYGASQGKPTWSWDYPGRTRTEAEVRAKVRQRGQEVMRAIVQAFPDVEILAYDTQFPETFAESWYKICCNIDNVYGSNTHIDFWNGLTSIDGYGRILFLNALFFKTAWVGPWDTVLQEEYNRLFSMLSRRLPHWHGVWSRLLESPFAWINAGTDPSGWDGAKPPAYVAEQLQAFRKWGQGRTFANFVYAALKESDYTPYVTALRGASTPGTVDSQPPRLFVTAPTSDASYTTASSTLRLAGHATDNLAIHAVLWSNDRGGAGAAPMVWQVSSGDYQTGWNWQMNWSIQSVPLQPGTNVITVTVRDIKGLSQSRTLRVTRH